MNEKAVPEIPEDLKPLCNRLVRQEPITAAEAWPLIERIATLTAEVAALKAELARRSAPVKFRRQKPFSVEPEEWDSARATPPQDAEKIGGGE